MRRRGVLGHAGLAGILASGCAPAVLAQPVIRWRLATACHHSLDAVYSGTEQFARQLGQLSGGRLQVTLLPVDDPVAPLSLLEALQAGEIDALHAVPSHFVGIDECFALDSAVPFGLNSRQMNTWQLEGNGLKLLRDFYAQYQIVNFPMGNSGAQMGGWFRRELESPADLSELRMQMGGLGARVLQSLGALPQQLPMSELVGALERGQLDAVEWVGPHDDRKLGLSRVARYYYYPGWWEGSAQLSLYCNAKAWRALPPDLKGMFELAAQSVHAGIQARYDVLNPIALKQVVAAGVRVKAFPKPVLDAAFKASNALCADLSRRNPAWRRIYADYSAFRREQNLWHRLPEAHFDRYLQSVRL
ncbi:ABC transporter substrate-binding protein [Malikia spinosa]|uniref:ABC transporter substrate-binding protein n=1 Tax=Malikia spinosa TaxID=86180 RepID=A0A2S9KEY8_9BURK|nr:ABC transporter substrate-binding protein [Malikia spinosa]PRD68997.1 ABC transporter substrate-binding protein [Malikia spinosa]